MVNLDVDGAAKRIEQAAIDAWMRTEADLGPWIKQGSVYSAASSARMLIVTSSGEFKLPPHQQDGEPLFEIGEPHDWTDYFQQSFAEIRATVSEILNPWRSIPDPEELSSPLTAMISMAKNLQLESTQSKGAILTANGELVTTIESIRANADRMSGETMEAFQEKFLRKLEVAIGSLRSAALARGNLADAHRVVWEKSRKKLHEILQWVEVGLREVAEGGEHSAQAKLGTLDFALKLAQLAPVGGVAAKIGMTAVSMAARNVPTENSAFWKPEDLRSCTGALSQVSTALAGLDKHSRSAEISINDYTVECIHAIEANRGLFDLRPSKIEARGLNDPREFSYPPFEINQLVTKYMPGFASEIQQIAASTSGKEISTALSRASIGLPPCGGGAQIDQLGELISALLLDLASEMQNGAIELGAALKEFLDLEDSIVEDTRKFLSELDASHDDDPLWLQRKTSKDSGQVSKALSQMMSENETPLAS